MIQKKQSLTRRLIWFVVGGVIGYLLNAGPFHLLHDQSGWEPAFAYAVSLTLATLIFFFWNYFINFRTDANWKKCAGRYLGVVGALYTANYLLAQLGFWLFPHSKYLVIAAVPFLLAGIKFYLYHFWVFPRFN